MFQIIERVIFLFAIVFNQNSFKLNVMVGNAKKREKKKAEQWQAYDIKLMLNNLTTIKKIN